MGSREEQPPMWHPVQLEEPVRVTAEDRSGGATEALPPVANAPRGGTSALSWLRRLVMPSLSRSAGVPFRVPARASADCGRCKSATTPTSPSLMGWLLNLKRLATLEALQPA